MPTIGSAGIFAGTRITRVNQVQKPSLPNFQGVEQHACNTTNNI